MSEKLSADNRFAIIPEWVIGLDISHTAFRLYAVLARYADNITHQAFPARATLAKRLECSEKTVDRAVEDLVKHGAIHKQSRGRYASALYTVITAAPSETEMSTEQTEMSSEQTNLSSRSDRNDHLTRTTELEPEELEPHKAMSESFNQFWEAYPKKVQKGDARKAFAKAVNLLGDAQQIIEGAERMAADPNLPPKQFIPYPASWLNGEGWEDEPFAPRDPLSIPGVTEGAKRSPYVGGPREWVKDMHDMGEHFECRPGEFGCR